MVRVWIIGLVLGSLLAGEADGASLRKQCRKSCKGRVVQCVATSGKRKKCRRATLRACMQQGLAYCTSGGSPLTYKIDPGIAPPDANLPDGRPLAAVRDANGTRSVFVANEVVVAPRDRAELDALLARTKGVVTADNTVPPPPAGMTLRSPDTGPTEYLVRVDPSGFALSKFAADAARAGIGGSVAISSDVAARLLALATHERAGGLKVTPNFVSEGAYLSSTQEHADGKGGYLDAFAVRQFGTTGSKSNVVRAWELVAARPPPRRSRVAIIDGGFWLDSQGRPMSTGTASDLPAQPAQWDFDLSVPIANGVNQSKCTGGSTCNYHGNGAAGVAVGLLGNRYGGAGTGGQVADPILLKSAPDWFKSSSAIRTAVQWGADVISMSWGAECDNSFCDLGAEAAGLYPALRNAWENGVVLVAAAGNDGQDTHSVPCRSDHVICVGALADSSNMAISYSNFGRFVDIWAPTNIPVMPDGDKAFVHSFGGTSASTPFIAGIAAMMRAYDASLDSEEILGLLLQTAWKDSPDPEVFGYVNAYEAVRAVAGNAPPEIQVVAPQQNQSLDINRLGGVHFKAQTNDLQDGPNCCTVTWHSLLDGDLGTGREIDYQFQTLGTRLISATVENSHGVTSSANVAVNITEGTPDIVIDSPAANAQLFEDTPYTLTGRDLGLDRCSHPQNGSWSSNGGSDTIGHPGCSVTAMFHGLGSRTLTLTVTNPYGAMGQASVTVLIVAKPAVVASVLDPSDGAAAFIGDLLFVSGYATGSQPLTLAWTWKSDTFGCPAQAIPVQASAVQPPPDTYWYTWDTGAALPGPLGCGSGAGEVRLTVTDNLSQTASNAVRFTLSIPPH